MVKRFSTVRDTERGSQSNMEKRRGRKEIEVTKRRRGGVKRRETDLASNPTPPTGRNLHNKKEPQTSNIHKGHPKNSNLNIIKILFSRKRNMINAHQTKQKRRR